MNSRVNFLLKRLKLYTFLLHLDYKILLFFVNQGNYFLYTYRVDDVIKLFKMSNIEKSNLMIRI